MDDGIHWKIEYYRDVWHDDTVTRTAKHYSKAGEVVSLANLIAHYGFAITTYAVVWIGDTVVGRYKRDTETREWREAE